MRMLYDDFSAFSRDQEHLISMNGVDYLEGSLITKQSPPNNWRSSFFSKSDYPRISSLLTENGIIYSIEVVKYYNDFTRHTLDEVYTESVVASTIIILHKYLIIICLFLNFFDLGTQRAVQRPGLSSWSCFHERCHPSRFSRPGSQGRTRASGERALGRSSSVAKPLCPEISYLGLQFRCSQGDYPQNKPDPRTPPHLPNVPKQVSIVLFFFFFHLEDHVNFFFVLRSEY